MNADKKFKQGGSAIALLILIMVVPIIIAGYTNYALTNQRMTQRAIQHMETRVVAENVVYMVAQDYHTQLVKNPKKTAKKLKEKLNKGQTKQLIKTKSINSAKSKRGFSLDDYISDTTQSGKSNSVTIITAVRNTRWDVTFGIKATYQVIGKDFLDYAMFTDGIFELSPAPDMTVDGKVRSNAAIRLGGTKEGTSTLLFTDQIWSADGISIGPGWSKTAKKAANRIEATDKNGINQKFFYKDAPLDSSHPNWNSQSKTFWGKNHIWHDAPALEVPISSGDAHELIEPKNEQHDDETQIREKIAWQVRQNSNNKIQGLAITVDKNGDIFYEYKGGAKTAISDTDKATPINKNYTDGSYELEPTKKIKGEQVGGWIEVDNTFKDGRETPNGVRVVNIYANELLKHFNNKVNMVYVQVEDEDGNLTPYLKAKETNPDLKLPAVRIRNGQDLSNANGFTIATHRMAYVEGNFNKGENDNDKISALIMADNLTILSNNWDDSNAEEKRPPASSTWLQAALVVGGYTYDPEKRSKPIEGLQNLVRYRENWKPDGVYHYDGSYIKLFNSQETEALASGSWFRPPIRNVTYNPALAANPPPGMPSGVDSASCIRWQEIPWDDAMSEISRVQGD